MTDQVELTDIKSFDGATVNSLTDYERLIIAHLREIATRRRHTILILRINGDDTLIYEARPCKRLDVKT